MFEQVARVKRGDHWRDTHGLVHVVWYVYPVGAVLLTCSYNVPRKAIGDCITAAPVTCLACLDYVPQ